MKRKFIMNKKAQGLSITSVVLAILAVVVIVILFFVITQGGFGKFNIFGGKVNVQDHVTSCQVACTTNSYFDYCEKIRTVVFDDKDEKKNITCDKLSKDFSKAGLATCGSITCTTPQPPAQPQQPAQQPGQDAETPPVPPLPPPSQ